MKKLPKRWILEKSKKILSSAAIATLLIQPLYLPLSGDTAFATTEEIHHSEVDVSTNASGDENSATDPVVQMDTEGETENSASASILINGQDVIDDTLYPGYSGELTITGSLAETLPDDATTTVGPTLTIGLVGSDNNPEVGSDCNQDNMPCTITFDSSAYEEGSFIIKYHMSYTLDEGVGDSIEVSEEVVIKINNRPTITSTIEPEYTDSNIAFEVTAQPKNTGETITSISANLLDSDKKLVRAIEGSTPLKNSEGDQWISTFSIEVVESGTYHIELSAISTDTNGTKKSASQTIEIKVTLSNVNDGDSNGIPVEDTLSTTPQVDDTDENDEEDKEDDKSIPDSILFSTGLIGNTDPFFTEIIGGRTIPIDNGVDSDDNSKSQTAGDAINKNETDEKGVAKLLGISWYWWVAILAVSTSIWSLIVAARGGRFRSDDL